MMRRIGLMTVLGFTMAIGLVACGPDADLVRSGKAHQCTLSKLKAQLAEKPQDPKIQEEIKSTTGLYETVIQSAGEGKKEALEKAIAAAVKDDGCP